MCDVTLDPVDMPYDGSGLNPGDVVCLNSGNWAQIRFFDITGGSGNPVVIQNTGGLVTMNGVVMVHLDNCKYVKLTGTGDGGFVYGIKIVDENLEADGRSTDLELEYIEMDSGKMELKDVVNATHEMNNVSVHDCWIHDTNAEGLYIGFSGCTGSRFLMRNVLVYDNLIEDTYEGIQVGACVEGMVIRDNTVTGSTPSQAAFTDAAIITNPCSLGAVYNNNVDDCDSVGIFVNNSVNASTYPVEVYNNRIHNVGHTASNRADGIRATQDYTTIYNNTIVNVGEPVTGNGFGVNLGAGSTHDLVYNCVVLDCEDNDIDQGGNPGGSFYNNDTMTEGYTPANYGFVNSTTFDYHLLAVSDGVDAGTNVGAPAFDLDNNPRPRGVSTDIGCYELQEGLPPTAVVDYRRRRV